MKKIVFLLMLGFAALNIQAQNPTATASKVGYADIDYIMNQMPEAKQVDTELKSTQTQLKNQIDAKAKEFQQKYQDYQANVNTMLDAVRVNTERELTQLQQNLEKLQQDAQTTITNKQIALFDPLYKKVGKAIEDVAKENGYTLIINTVIGNIDAVLYGDDQSNISDLVLKKLGITPKPATNPTTQNPPKQ